MMLVIKLPLEAFRHVIDILDPGFDQYLSGLERAYAAAADQDHRRCPGRTSEHRLAHQRDEMGIDFPVGLVDPGDVYGPRRMADKQKLHVRTHVDEHGVGMVREELVGLLGMQGFDFFAHVNLADLGLCQSRPDWAYLGYMLPATTTAILPATPRPSKPLLRAAGSAIADYTMIRPGDRVLLGLSGGKDSLSLLHVLLHLRDKSPVRFELGAATVDPAIEGFDPSFLQTYVPDLGIPYFYRRQDIVERALKTMRGDSFCAYCSRMRRGILYATAREHGYNVLALAHHLDDLAESFLMSAFYGGSLRTMKAHYVNDAGDLRIIRPFIYVRERQTADFARRAGLPAIMDNCPACFSMPTQRMHMKSLLSDQEKSNKKLFSSILTAIRPLISDKTPD
jgi:tRNA 2-thiocytidine biosynthesis protein TtcA